MKYTMNQRLGHLQSILYDAAAQCASIAHELARLSLCNVLQNAEVSCEMAAKAIEGFRAGVIRAFPVADYSPHATQPYVEVLLGDTVAYWPCHPYDTFRAGQYVIVGRDGLAAFPKAGDPLLVVFDGQPDIVVADGAGGFSMAPGNWPEVQP